MRYLALVVAAAAGYYFGSQLWVFIQAAHH
jgi:hypothetical protein